MTTNESVEIAAKAISDAIASLCGDVIALDVGLDDGARAVHILAETLVALSRAADGQARE